METQTPIANAVLLTTFPKLSRLDDFLQERLDHGLAFIQSDDSPDYKNLLHSTLVSTMEGHGHLKPFPTGNKPCPDGIQTEVVQQAINLTCPNSRGQYPGTFNILAAGYTKSKTVLSQYADRFFPNTLEAFVKTSHWQILLERIGTAAMMYLLANTFMFAALPNNCYCQITGPSISELIASKKRLRPHVLSSLPSKKHKPLPLSAAQGTSSNNAHATTTNSLVVSAKQSHGKSTSGNATLISSIIFQRSRTFYVKTVHSEHKTLSQFLLYPYTNSSPTTSPTLIERFMYAIFPRQHGLMNVFQGHYTRFKKVDKLSSKGPTITKSKSQPWRLRKMKRLVQEMIELNGRCKYMFLLQHYCPVKAVDELRDTEKEEPSTADLLASSSTYDQVTSFVHAITKHVVPLAMFGSTDNRDVVLRAMTKFIHLRKYESISLQYVLQGFKMSECGWLQDSRNEDPRASVRHLPPSASEKQFEILCEFLYWLFDGFLVPLLQASFYVTDSSYQKNKLFYYRHELWRRIMKSAVNSLQERMFIKMDEDEVALCRRPFATVRFLPKTNDLRPIINLRKKATRLVNGSYASGTWSMNQTLSNAFLVLACERNRQFISSSAIGMSDLYHRLKQLKTKLVDPTQPNQSKLYFVKVDIRRSFDSINQDKLMEVVDNVLQEDRYVIQRYSKIMPTKGQITKLFVSKALPVNELPNMQFLDHACNVAETSKHAVLVDKVVHPCESKQSVMSLIQAHVQDNIIRFGKGYFRQTTGIPQGSILSPALCRLFYDDMENGALSGFTHQSDSALLRLADDFLFVSRSKERATAFLNVMAQGHPEYGCFINQHKTVTNFDVQLNGEPVRKCDRNAFPYCGYLLNTQTLDARVDFTRYKDEDIRNLLTVERTRHPGRSIVLKMRKAMQHQCQMAFADTSFNSFQTVLLNVYQNFVFCAMKFHVYTQELIQDPVTAHHIQKECLAAIVLDIFKVCYGLLHNGRRSAMGIAAGAKFEVAERHVKWLGATAFRATLPAIPLYGPLKDVLKERVLVPLNNSEKVHFKRKLSSVVNDARNEIMKDIKYTVAHHKY